MELPDSRRRRLGKYWLSIRFSFRHALLVGEFRSWIEADDDQEGQWRGGSGTAKSAIDSGHLTGLSHLRLSRTLRARDAPVQKWPRSLQTPILRWHHRLRRYVHINWPWTNSKEKTLKLLWPRNVSADFYLNILKRLVMRKHTFSQWKFVIIIIFVVQGTWCSNMILRWVWRRRLWLGMLFQLRDNSERANTCVFPSRSV